MDVVSLLPRRVEIGKMVPVPVPAGPGPGLICFSAGPGMFFFIKYWTIYFLIFYLFFLVRIYKSPIFIYDPDRSRLLTSVLIAKLRIIDNYLEGRVVWV